MPDQPQLPSTSTQAAWGGAEIGLHLLTCCGVGTGLGWAIHTYGLGSASGVGGGIIGAVVGFVAWLYMLWKLVKSTNNPPTAH